jgi:hypothetical protein
MGWEQVIDNNIITCDKDLSLEHGDREVGAWSDHVRYLVPDQGGFTTHTRRREAFHRLQPAVRKTNIYKRQPDEKLMRLRSYCTGSAPCSNLETFQAKSF